jgi:hypothetical protein
VLPEAAACCRSVLKYSSTLGPGGLCYGGGPIHSPDAATACRSGLRGTTHGRLQEGDPNVDFLRRRPGRNAVIKPQPSSYEQSLSKSVRERAMIFGNAAGCKWPKRLGAHSPQCPMPLQRRPQSAFEARARDIHSAKPPSRGKATPVIKDASGEQR